MVTNAHQEAIEINSLDEIPPEGLLVGEAGILKPNGKLEAVEPNVLSSLRNMPGKKYFASLALATTLGLSMSSCKKDIEEITVHVEKPAVSQMTVGEDGVFYKKAAEIGAGAADASLYNRVITQPGFMNNTYGFGVFQNNNVAYMSGISLVSKSLSTSSSTFVPPLSVLDLEGNIDKINGWLRDASGNKVATTFSANNAPESRAYMLDLRKPEVQDLVVAYGSAISRSNPSKKGVIIDEADQASYFNAQFPGLQSAFAETYKRIAWSNYYGYPLADEFTTNSAGQRTSNINLEKGADGYYVAKNVKTGQTYTSAKLPTDAFSGIQPTPDGNFASDDMLKNIAYAYCNLTLESRVYDKANHPTDATYRAAVTERLMKFADYQKEAGRKEFTISSYEPATNNTSAGYQAAAIETAKFWDGIRKQVEAKGLKLKVNLMIGGVNSDGYFLNDSPQDFIEGRKLKQTLKNNPALGGIEIVYNEPQKPHAPVGQLYEADKFQDVPDLQLGKDGKATISWAAAKTLNKVSDIQKREGGFADKYEADKANAPTERTV